jgi:hypothetical protein
MSIGAERVAAPRRPWRYERLLARSERGMSERSAYKRSAYIKNSACADLLQAQLSTRRRV